MGTLITGGYDGNAVLWNLIDPSRPRRVTVLSGNGGVIRVAAVSRDSRTAVIGTDRGRLLVWDMSAIADVLADPRLVACDIVDRGLAPDEWRGYAPKVSYRKNVRAVRYPSAMAATAVRSSRRRTRSVVDQCPSANASATRRAGQRRS